MLQLLLSILSSTLILILFKWMEKKELPLIGPIVVNYFMAAVLGFVLSDEALVPGQVQEQPWFYFAILIGILLIANFYLIGTSTQKSGITITSIASKMSFVLPVSFSLFYDKGDIFSPQKLLLLLLACVAVVFVVLTPKIHRAKRRVSLLPLAIFVGLGLLDSLVKYCQYTFIHTASDSAVFSAFNFFFAALVGILVLVLRPAYLKLFTRPYTWIAGLLLGTVNFGSMYFFINALNAIESNSSLVFGINNVGVVALSVFVAVILYKERYTRLNWLGVALAIAVLLMMMVIV